MTREKPARSVLLLAPHPFFAERGTPIAVRDLARILTENGWEVTILTLGLGDDPRIDGVEIFRTPRIPFIKTIGIGLSFGKLVADVFLFFSLMRLLARRRFVVYHAVEESIFLAWVAARLFPAKLIYDMDSCLGDQIVEKFPRFARMRSFFRLAERFVMRRVDWILPVCPALADIAAELAPDTPKTTLHDIPPLRRKFAPGEVVDLRDGLIEEMVLGLYVGNFEGYQGVDLLIGAMEALEANCPLKIVLAGGGANTEQLRERVENGLAKGRVLFPGPQPLDHLHDLLQQADILISPRSKGVNTPMKLYAYLEAAKPVLATNILSHTQILNEENAFLVDEDVANLANGLRTLSHDQTLREKLGKAAGELSVSNFSRESLRDKIMGAYAEMTSKSNDSIVHERSL